MIKIGIEWEFISPSLKAISGIVTITRADFEPPLFITDKELLKFYVRKECGLLHFKFNEKETPNELFEKFRDKIKTMVESYYHGVIMNKCDYCWVEENTDIVQKL